MPPDGGHYTHWLVAQQRSRADMSRLSSRWSCVLLAISSHRTILTARISIHLRADMRRAAHHQFPKSRLPGRHVGLDLGDVRHHAGVQPPPIVQRSDNVFDVQLLGRRGQLGRERRCWGGLLQVTARPSSLASPTDRHTGPTPAFRPAGTMAASRPASHASSRVCRGNGGQPRAGHLPMPAFGHAEMGFCKPNQQLPRDPNPEV